MQELGLQSLHKQLISHSLCQGICNHLSAKECVSTVFIPITISLGISVFTVPTCQTEGLGSQGPCWLLALGNQVTAPPVLEMGW